MAKTHLTVRDYQTALDVQNACNLSGVVIAFAEIMQRLCKDVHSTTDRNRHPICVLFAEQIKWLTLSELGYTAAYDACIQGAMLGPQPGDDPDTGLPPDYPGPGATPKGLPQDKALRTCCQCLYDLPNTTRVYGVYDNPVYICDDCIEDKPYGICDACGVACPPETHNVHPDHPGAGHYCPDCCGTPFDLLVKQYP